MVYDVGLAEILISIIVGLCFTKVWICISQHIIDWKKTKWYLPYFLYLIRLQVFQLMVLFLSRHILIANLDNQPYITFFLFMLSLLIPCVHMALPSDKFMEQDQVDLKEFYIETLPIWYTMYFLFTLLDPVTQYFSAPLELDIAWFGKRDIDLLARSWLYSIGFYTFLMVFRNNAFIHSLIHIVNLILSIFVILY